MVSRTNTRALASILIARDENADFVGLVADYIFSDGSLTYIAERVEKASIQAAFTVDFWVKGEAAGPIFGNSHADDGTLSIPPHKMMQVFGENISARVYFNDTGPHLKSIPSDPSRMYCRLSNGLRIDNLQPQLFFASPSVIRDFWSIGLPMTDNGFVDLVLTAVGDFRTSEMLVDPARFGCIVLDYDEGERARTGHYPERVQKSGHSWQDSRALASIGHLEQYPDCCRKRQRRAALMRRPECDGDLGEQRRDPQRDLDRANSGKAMDGEAGAGGDVCCPHCPDQQPDDASESQNRDDPVI